jgi:hypothetical protein
MWGGQSVAAALFSVVVPVACSEYRTIARLLFCGNPLTINPGNINFAPRSS